MADSTGMPQLGVSTDGFWQQFEPGGITGGFSPQQNPDGSYTWNGVTTPQGWQPPAYDPSRPVTASGTMMPTDPNQHVQGPSGPSLTNNTGDPNAPIYPGSSMTWGQLRQQQQNDAATGQVSQPNATGTGGSPTGGNLQDPAYAAQLVSYYASQPGANPSLKNDPNYWIGKITSGELGPDVKYIVSKFMQPEGAPAGSGGSGSGVGGQYGYGQYGQPFTMPTTANFEGSPGFQWAVKQGQNAIQNSAAARGTLLTGGTLKALAGYTTGAASQNYNDYFNQQYQTAAGNYGIWRNNQNDTSDNLFRMAQLGKPA